MSVSGKRVSTEISLRTNGKTTWLGPDGIAVTKPHQIPDPRALPAKVTAISNTKDLMLQAEQARLAQQVQLAPQAGSETRGRIVPLRSNGQQSQPHQPQTGQNNLAGQAAQPSSSNLPASDDFVFKNSNFDKALTKTTKILGGEVLLGVAFAANVSEEADILFYSNNTWSKRGVYYRAAYNSYADLIHVPAVGMMVAERTLAESVSPSATRAARQLGRLEEATKKTEVLSAKISLISARISGAARQLRKMEGVIKLVEKVAGRVNPDAARQLSGLREAIAVVINLADKAGANSAKTTKQLDRLRKAIETVEKLYKQITDLPNKISSKIKGYYEDPNIKYLIKTLEILRDEYSAAGGFISGFELEEEVNTRQRGLHDEIQRRSEQRYYLYQTQAKIIRETDIPKLDFIVEALGNEVFKPGEMAVEVRVLLRAMKKMNYYNGPINGFLSGSSLSALSKLLKKKVTSANASTFKEVRDLLSQHASKLLENARSIGYIYCLPNNRR